MIEYIEKKATADHLFECSRNEEISLSIGLGFLAAADVVAAIPPVDVVPVVHAKWVKDGDFFVCLNCESEINIKNSLGVENHKNFCPNCGAKMVLKE